MIAIRKILIIRAANQAMAFSIPTLAAVLSFVTYGSTQDNLDPVSTETSTLPNATGCYFHLLGAFQSAATATHVSAPRVIDVDGCADCGTQAGTSE
jgi:hypothetical protein